MPKFQQVCGPNDIKKIKNNSAGTPSKIIWSNDSITHLMSTEQDDMVFEGTTIDYAWCDEPLRRSIFVALKRGLMAKSGLFWMTCTPLDEPWIYDELYMPGLSKTDPNIEIFEGATSENLTLTQKQIDDFKKILTSDEIEARFYGKFRHLSGRVFKEYSPEKNKVPSFDIPPHWPVWCAIDPHRNKQNAALWLAISPQGKKYICNELYHKCTIYELAEFVNDISSQYNIVQTLIDTSAQEDGWNKVSAREMLVEKGIFTKLAQKKNQKDSGLVLINQLFNSGDLFVMEHCLRTHRELINQVYKKNKRDDQIVLEEPEKKWDDITDCLRYILVERPNYEGPAKIKERGPVYTIM